MKQSVKTYLTVFMLGMQLYPLWLHAQTKTEASLDSIVQLKSFTLSASRYTQTIAGQKSETLDSSKLHVPAARNLADLLAQQNSLFVKSYGLGGLALGSFRGTMAAHTATLWNGFNLQSPMNGLLDYALLPAVFMDDVKLNLGGSGALYGSGSVGGTILLTNSALFNQGFESSISASVGSFEEYQQSIKVAWSNNKVACKLRLFNHSAENNFPFVNTAVQEKPIQRQQNAALEQQGALFESYIRPSKNQKISVRFWYQNNQRQIPATIVSKPGQQEQVDKFYRTTLEWNAGIKRHKLSARLAYFDERIEFTDVSTSLDETSQSKASIVELEDIFDLTSQLQIELGVLFNYATALSDGYGSSKPNLQRFAGYGALSFVSKNRSWNSRLSVRKEYFGTTGVPFTPSLGTEKLLFSWLKLSATISRNYRVPTFNDLFWTEQGAKGNKQLIPESGWSGDVGISSTINKNNFKLEAKANFFLSKLNNMIVWQPGTDGIWTPQNVSIVQAHGVEASSVISYKLKKFKFEIKPSYSYTISIDKSQQAVNTTYGKQLFYVPIHLYKVETAIHYQKFSVSYFHTYCGKRFINNENTSYLNPYQLDGIRVAQLVLFNKFGISAFFEINNILNKQYQIIAWRAMPGINFQAGLSISFHSTKNK